MPLSPNQRLGSYEIVCSLGAGGMGQVYRARDTRLGRDVALKVLPPEVVKEAGRLERFDREARAIAALNHPHIVTIYSTEEADGIRFLTMELVDGPTLSDLVMPAGLSLPRFLEIAIPLADALAAAHQKQITHRDLKPGNVMLSNDGRVKVLDFGLARVGGADAGEQTLIATQAPITHQGMIVGTMPYMSPEQVEGRPIDPRSDLFSLGVIFYELLSGARPFTGSSSPALMSAILRDQPSSVREKRADVPEALDRLITRLLEKRPEDRVQTARDVFNELRHITGGRATGIQRQLADRSATESLSVAVLPFAVRGGDPEADALATGLTEDVTAGLAKFDGLSVVAPQSTRGYQDSPLDVRQIAERLGARYVIGGSVRTSGDAVRATTQLIDAQSGAQLWTETYDRTAGEMSLFTIQDDLTDRVVATIADQSGLLAKSMIKTVRQQAAVAESSPSQLIVHGWAFDQRPTLTGHAELRSAVESRLANYPDHAPLWALASMLYLVEHTGGFNPRPDAVDRAMHAARRSVELEPGHQPGWQALALVCFSVQDRRGMNEAGEKAIKLNPRNAYTLARMGIKLTHAGEYDRGCALIDRAMSINPGLPGWLHRGAFNRFFARGEYSEALAAARRVNLPEFMLTHFDVAAAAGHLGLVAEGRAALDAMLRLAPALAESDERREFVTRRYWPEEMIESLLDGVQQAFGLSTQSTPRSESTSLKASGDRNPKPPSSTSGTTGSGALSVAVLPFVPRSSDEESKSLADGLTDDITSGLSRFGYLRVLSRSTPAANARYTISGQVRKAGAMLRISATLADTDSGANIWAQNYDRAASDTPFAIQDDVASSVVATLGDQTGVLMRSMAESLAMVPLEQLSNAELVIRFHAYHENVRSDEHLRLRTAFEQALERDPQSAEGWACLAMLYEHEHGLGFNRLPNTRERHRQAAERAVALNPRSQQAWSAMAPVHLFARDRAGVRVAADRVAALNPLNADLVVHTAIFLGLAGDHERALALTNEAMARKPQHPSWYHFVPFNFYYSQGKDEAALREARRFSMPQMPQAQISAAAVAGQLGLHAEARVCVDALRAIDPALTTAEAARQAWSPLILDEAFLERLVDGFAKALTLVDVPSNAHSGDRAPSIAVLPFTDLSEKKDQDWFCDGIAEEILNALAALPGLRVAARASAFSLRGRSDDLGAIGEKLNVATVLDGSVRRSGDRVRITTRLSDTKRGEQLWSERFDRGVQDIFDVQDEIARAIAERLRVTIDGRSERLVAKATTNIEAYQLLLKGRVFLNRRGPAIVNAIPCFEQAIALDPNLADAHAGLGDTYRLFGIYGLLPAAEALPLARASLERALALDPDQVEALATLANIMHAFEWKYTEARALSDRALQLDPSHVRALGESAITLATAMAANPSESLKQLILDRIGRARQLDPLSAWAMAIEAMVLVVLGRDQEAVEAAKRAVVTDPNNFTAHWSKVFTLAQLDRAAEAEEAAKPGLAMSSRHPMLLADLATLHGRSGDRAGAESIYQELTERAKTAFISPGARAVAAAAAGRLSEARRLLAQALAERDAFISFHKLAAFRPIWEDAECAAMLRQSALMQNQPV